MCLRNLEYYFEDMFDLSAMSPPKSLMDGSASLGTDKANLRNIDCANRLNGTRNRGCLANEKEHVPRFHG